jgi:SAM-dependent methyltransferase
MLDSLSPTTRQLIENHDLRLGARSLVLFRDDIRAGASDTLIRLANSGVSPNTVSEAIHEIVRRKTVAECAYWHRAGAYFSEAEQYMRLQWQGVIWPIIQNEDFTHTLDLACGHGRNTEYLSRYATSIDLVDVNQSCIDACRRRFGSQRNGCNFRYHLTDGTNLRSIPESSISLVYSWDSMVHFDKLVVSNYVAEIARVLKPGGTAFLHHSNLGSSFPNSNWTKNHGTRSDMSAELMNAFAAAAGLAIKFQRLSGKSDGWGEDDLDCLSLLQKPI